MDYPGYIQDTAAFELLVKKEYLKERAEMKYNYPNHTASEIAEEQEQLDRSYSDGWFAEGCMEDETFMPSVCNALYIEEAIDDLNFERLNYLEHIAYQIKFNLSAEDALIIQEFAQSCWLLSIYELDSETVKETLETIRKEQQSKFN